MTRRLFITGGAGFVGTHLRRRLSEYEVLAPRKEQLDLLDFDATARWLHDNRPEVVIHAASVVGGIGARSGEHAHFLADTARMGLNVVQAADAAGVQHLLHIGSATMYSPASRGPVSESALDHDGRLDPAHDGYARAKRMIAALCRHVTAERSARRYVTVVPCGLYGPGDSMEPARAHLVASAIAKVRHALREQETSVQIWGDGHARRELLYVEDFVEFVVLALNHLDQLSPAINVGTGEDHSVISVYGMVASALGYDGALTFDTNRPVGEERSVLDVSRARGLGWTSTTPLEEGIRRTVAALEPALEPAREHV